MLAVSCGGLPTNGWRRPSRRAVHVVAVVGLGTVIALAVGTGSAEIGRVAAAPGSSSRVAAVYLRDCAVCHRADGEGIPHRGPTLLGVGAASVDFWISSGRMPLAAVGDEPTRAAPRYPRIMVQALVRYVARLAAGDAPAVPTREAIAGGSVAAGGVLFRAQCAACHAWSGDGGALLHRAAPTTHPASSTQIAEAVRTGPGAMPAFGRAALTDRQLRDVIAYTRRLASPDDRGGFDLAHLGPVAEGAIAVVIGLGVLLLAIRWIGTAR
jgi:ubiquinol-cytochrome c reductase cytochrome c subunit